MRMIGFHGPAGAGKSTAANIACRELAAIGWHPVRHSFADCIRAVAAALAGEQDPDVYLSAEFKRQESPFASSSDPHIRLINREYLQAVGRMIRAQFFNGVLRATEIRMPAGSERLVAVYDDVRMPDEAQWIKSHGGIVLRIAGPDRTGTMSKRAMLDATARALPLDYTNGPAIENRGDIAVFESAVRAAVRGYFGGR